MRGITGAFNTVNFNNFNGEVRVSADDSGLVVTDVTVADTHEFTVCGLVSSGDGALELAAVTLGPPLSGEVVQTQPNAVLFVGRDANYNPSLWVTDDRKRVV